MIPVYQTIRTPPRGNCFAACVASIFEVDLADVPNFTSNDPPGRWFVDWNDWLAQHNLHMDAFELSPGCPPWARAWTIGSVDSPRGPWLHAVVFEGTALRHDPWQEDGIMAPSKVGAVRDFVLFYPIDPSKPAGIPRSGAYAARHDIESGGVAP